MGLLIVVVNLFLVALVIGFSLVLARKMVQNSLSNGIDHKVRN